MRKTFGYFALAAAVVIVAYSASTLFSSAFHSMKDPWQQWQTAIGASAVVLWEATALSLVGWAWHRGYKPIAVLGVPLLILACLVSLFWESSLLTSGQSDHYAERNAMVEAKDGAKQDLAWFRDRRASLKTSKPSPAIARELAWIDGRITELQSSRIAITDASPQASWLARLTGWPMQLAADVSLLVVLLFWMLARVVAVPLAQIAFIQPKSDAMLTDRIASDRPDLSRPVPKHASIEVSTAVSTPVSMLAEAPAQLAQPRLAQPTASNVTPLRHADFDVKKKTSGEGSVMDWLADCTSQATDKKTAATHLECRRSYMAWCASKGLHPIGARAMTRQMRTTLRCSARNGAGAVFHGLLVFQPSSGVKRA